MMSFSDKKEVTEGIKAKNILILFFHHKPYVWDKYYSNEV